MRSHQHAFRVPFCPGLALVALAGLATAQQSMDVGSLPMVEGPGTQGFVVYRGPATPNFFWYCDTDGVNYDTIGEIAEEVHMLQAGDLASITFAYHVQGNNVISSGLASAVLKFYANDPSDTLAPPAGLLASYTMTGLPWSTTTNHTATFDLPAPFPVSEDLWIGIDIVTLGQYLRPTPKHAEVARYVTPEEFSAYENHAKSLGFSFVASGALVRSSYHAAEGFVAARLGAPTPPPPRAEVTPLSSELVPASALVKHRRV